MTEQTQADVADFAESGLLVDAHVPPEMMLDYDFVDGPEILEYPPAALDKIRDERPVFHSTLFGGFWLFTRYEDIRLAFQNPGLLKQNEGIPAVPYGRKFIPLRLDPPEHIVYRRLLTPIFSPRQIAKLEVMIRGVARRRLAAIAPLGEANLSTDFALALPAAMFCGFIGFPAENLDMFYKLAHDVIFGPSIAMAEKGPEVAKAVRADAMAAIDKIVAETLAERRQRLGDDAISILIESKVHDRPVSDEEILNMVTLLFFAGSDSTASSIVYALGFLAEHPEYKQKIIDHIDDPEYLWKASEELLRFQGFHHISRTVTRDEEFQGVSLKKGDIVILPVASANRDARRFPDPLKVDFERDNAHSHLTFGAGVHRCIGSHMATAQLRIALSEIHRAIPDYTLTKPVEYVSIGPKAVPTALNVRYTPTAFSA